VPGLDASEVIPHRPLSLCKGEATRTTQLTLTITSLVANTDRILSTSFRFSVRDAGFRFVNLRSRVL
jgi:hypothetical protein